MFFRHWAEPMAVRQRRYLWKPPVSVPDTELAPKDVTSFHPQEAY